MPIFQVRKWICLGNLSKVSLSVKEMRTVSSSYLYFLFYEPCAREAKVGDRVGQYT